MWAWLIAIVLFIVCAAPVRSEDDCFKKFAVATAPTGSPLILSTKELDRMAVRRVMPKMPRMCRCQGTVVLRLLIDEKGEVRCIKVDAGHPLMTTAAVDAARQWRFRPVMHQGRQVPFIGHLMFSFSTGGVRLLDQVQPTSRRIAPRRSRKSAPPAKSRATDAVAFRGLKTLRENITPAVDNCGLGKYPVSRPSQDIVAAAPRERARSRNSMMLAKVAIAPDGRVTHLRVLRLAYPEASNTDSINMQAVDSIKVRRYSSAVVGGQPVAACSDVEVTIDLR